jgi:hypothetical protein
MSQKCKALPLFLQSSSFYSNLNDKHVCTISMQNNNCPFELTTISCFLVSPDMLPGFRHTTDKVVFIRKVIIIVAFLAMETHRQIADFRFRKRKKEKKTCLGAFF